MSGLAGRVAEGLRELRRRDRWWGLEERRGWSDAEAEELRRYEEGETPSLERLAEILRRYQVGLAKLEALCTSPEPPSPHSSIDPVLVVERLDVGLAGLRTIRGFRRQHVAEAAGVRDSDLAELERGEHPEPPPIETLDRLLRALDADYGDLEEVIRDPFRELRRTQRRERRSSTKKTQRPVTLEGRLLPEAVTDRLDVALRALREGAGMSRRKLAEASGVEAGRIQRMEQYRGERPTDEELSSILAVLGVGSPELNEAARKPFQLRRELGRLAWSRGAVVIRGERASTLVSQRFDIALRVLRTRMHLSRRHLAERAGLTPERILQLESAATEGPTGDELQRLAHALDAQAEDFERAAEDPVRELLGMVQRARAATARAQRKVAKKTETDTARPELVARLEREGAGVGWALERLLRAPKGLEKKVGRVQGG